MFHFGLGRTAPRRLVVTMTCLAGIAMMVLAACGSSSGDTGKNSRVLNFAWNAPADELDPHLANISGSASAIYELYDRLTQLKPGTLDVGPMLATSWSFSRDGSQFTMKLRKGVRFHDGAPFNATAVVVNIKREQTVPGSAVKSQLTAIKSVVAVDPYTVRFAVAAHSAASLPVSFSGLAGAMVSPKALTTPTAAAKLKTTPDGSGPYLLKSFVPSGRYSLSRAGSYWGPEPYYTTVNVQTVTDFSSRLSGLETGQFDAVTAEIDNQDPVRQLVDGGQYARSDIPNINILTLVLRAKGPLAGEPARQAIQSAIDVPALAKSLGGGDCTAPTTLVDRLLATPVSAQLPFDVPKSRQLRGQAGGSIKFDVTTTASSIAATVGVAVQAQLAKAGINMNLTPLTSAEAQGSYFSGQYDGLITSVPSTPGAADTLVRALSSYQPAGAASSAITALLDKSQDQAVTSPQQAAAVHSATTMLAKSALFVPLCGLKQIVVYRKQIQGWNQLPWQNVYDFRYLHAG